MTATATDHIEETPLSDDASGENAVPASPATDASSVERMAQLKRLVRVDGLSPDDAAREIGIDPIIAQLWLRLPDDLWPNARAVGGTGSGSVAQPAPPSSGLRRVITCRVPVPAYDRLRTADGSIIEAAASALETGLTLPRPDHAPGSGRYPRRPLAVPVSAEAFTAIASLAEASFNGDVRDAAGWLIARGLGLTIGLPTAAELAGLPPERPATAPAQRLMAAAPAPRFVVPPRRRPETRAPLPPDDSAPNGDELRQRREAIGISQRDLAAASGLSRGLVAEVERGRRRHVLTRLRLSETLASLERSK